MNLVQTIDTIVNWLNENVCPGIELKLPDDYKNDASYGVELVNPAAFPLYVPGKDRLPPSVAAPIPSVCVQLMEGADDLIKSRRTLQIRLCLACWNPGTHGDATYKPEEDPDAVGGISYYRTHKGADQNYTRNMDGWRDSFNFADRVLRAVENAEYIDGLKLVTEAPIKFGLFVEDGNIWDYYPYWHNWISFEIDTGVAPRSPEAYTELL